MNVLGLDISSSIVGITILNEDGMLYNKALIFKPKRCKKTKTDTPMPWFEKLDLVKQTFQEIATFANNEFTIDKLCIEDYLKMFKGGKTSAETLFTLARFNAVVSYIARDIFKIDPTYYTVSAIRKSIGFTVPKGFVETKEYTKKDYVLDKVVEDCPTFVVRYTAKGHPEKGVYDRADSYAVAKAGLSGRCKPVEKVKRSKRDTGEPDASSDE